jgi:hypothetical protein
LCYEELYYPLFDVLEARTMLLMNLMFLLLLLFMLLKLMLLSYLAYVFLSNTYQEC